MTRPCHKALKGVVKLGTVVPLVLRECNHLQQEVDVALEEDFNEAMLAMLRDLPMQDIYQVCSTHVGKQPPAVAGPMSCNSFSMPT